MPTHFCCSQVSFFTYILPGPYGNSEIWVEVSGEYVVKVGVAVVLVAVRMLFVMFSGEPMDAIVVIVRFDSVLEMEVLAEWPLQVFLIVAGVLVTFVSVELLV